MTIRHLTMTWNLLFAFFQREMKKREEREIERERERERVIKCAQDKQGQTQLAHTKIHCYIEEELDCSWKTLTFKTPKATGYSDP